MCLCAASVDDGRDRPRPRSHSKAMDTAVDNLCLLRATSGKRKIRTVVRVKRGWEVLVECKECCNSSGVISV